MTKHSRDTRGLPEGTETRQAGKLTLHRSQMGTVWFVDDRGIRRTVDDPSLGIALFETVKHGSGEANVTELTEGSRPSSNVESRGTVIFKPPM